MAVPRQRFLFLFGVPLLVLFLGLELMLWRSVSPSMKVKAMRYHVYAFLEVGIILMLRYIWRKVTDLTINSSPIIKHTVRVLLSVFLVPSGVNFIVMQFWLSHEPNTIALLCSYMLGIIVLVFVGLASVDIIGYLLRITILTSTLTLEQKHREKRVRTICGLVIGVLLSIFGLVGVRNIVIEPVTIPVVGLHPSLNGTTIAQLSDIHLGPYIGRSRLTKIVDITNTLNADIVVITGDLSDSTVEIMAKGVEPLKNLKTKYGVYFCTGNHDYYTGDIDNWITHLSFVNVHPLINARACLFAKDTETCQNGLYIAGIEDIDTRRLHYGNHSMDLHRALLGRTKAVPTIVLAHQPKAAAEAIEWSDVRLVLSGHTHAGQVFPFMVPVYLYNPYFVGLYQPHDNVYVYVSPGVNYFTLPLRHYRPGITLVTLTTKSH